MNTHWKPVLDSTIMSQIKSEPRVPTFCASQFTWLKNHGICEMSCLGIAVRVPAQFYVKSPKTGVSVHFTVNDLLREQGEITGWTCSSSTGKFTITLFND